MPGELARDAGLSAEHEVTRVMKNAIDRFRQELQNCFCRLKDLNSKFGFLLADISDLLRDRNEKELEALRSDCTQFGTFGSFYMTLTLTAKTFTMRSMTVRCCSTLAVTLCPRLL
jgi:hypothetical protein